MRYLTLAPDLETTRIRVEFGNSVPGAVGPAVPPSMSQVPQVPCFGDDFLIGHPLPSGNLT